MNLESTSKTEDSLLFLLGKIRREIQETQTNILDCVLFEREQVENWFRYMGIDIGATSHSQLLAGIQENISNARLNLQNMDIKIKELEKEYKRVATTLRELQMKKSDVTLDG